MWQIPIYDRTAANVTEGADKCYLNAETLNRIESNTAYMASLLGAKVATRHWEATDFLTRSEMERILQNIQAVRDAYFVLPGTSDLPEEPTTLYYGSAGVTATVEDLMLVASNEIPSVYTPYTGQTNTLTLPETVYGGEVDAVTGDGKETWKLATLDGNSTVTTYRENDDTDTYKGFAVYNAIAGVDIHNNAACSHFKRGLASSQGYYPNTFLAHENGTLYIRTEIPGITSVETFKAYIAAQYAAGTPVQVGYKLAEPVPFTATGAQALPALAGVNTVLTDANSMTVTGRADPIKRITDLEDATASQT